MKFAGGYDVLLAGKPSRRVHELADPDVLYLPLTSRRFEFSEIAVKEGQRVRPGQVLARDPEHYSVPLIGPRAGTVRLESVENHIVLEDVTNVPEEPYEPDEDLPHIPKTMGSVGMRRYKLLTLGAWQFVYDAHSGDVPDPFGTPSAVIVSTLHLEPYVARGDVQIRKRLTSFTRGLEQLQSLLEYQPIYLVLPDIRSALALEVKDKIRGYAWAKLVEVPLRYPFDSFPLLARKLGLRRDADNPVWALGTDGVLALDRALTLSLPSTVRIVSLGGPQVSSPVHLKAMPGYPLKLILDSRISSAAHRVIAGGVLTGKAVQPEQLGLDTECQGLTVLPEHSDREFLGFMRPGFNRRSYSTCFMSSVRGAFSERLTTALRGERRPCISCGLCEEVCPAGIAPHQIHKYLYQDALEEVERARLDLCVECGLCSYVCPSKIELRAQFLEAKENIRAELHAEEDVA